ncbi:unnamed protein product [Miscanthus lutarioriparius]|uniref:Uncharacterized protein n=1 Tax=Miscanthus lutarioriparius TaxID=422564 RepID=A0A811RY40_9POAL|nr:unnamed protein product [Miscanthus lutarioriparius]
MDGAATPKAGSGGKAVLPVPAGIDAGAATSSARGARKATLPAGAADAPAAATASPGGESNGGGEEEDDDEQVERFYALLDNIRAMRGAYVSGSGDGTVADDGVDAGGGGGARVKRLRGSEPPWRPAFRLEDFEEPAPTSSSSDVAPCAKRTRGQEAEADGEGSGGARPDVAAVVRVRVDSGRKSV